MKNTYFKNIFNLLVLRYRRPERQTKEDMFKKEGKVQTNSLSTGWQASPWYNASMFTNSPITQENLTSLTGDNITFH